MNKYEKTFKDFKKLLNQYPTYHPIDRSDRLVLIGTIKELVDKDKNGIYISKEESTELLEALEIVKEEVREYGWQYCIESYNKLYKALGGEIE